MPKDIALKDQKQVQFDIRKDTHGGVSVGQAQELELGFLPTISSSQGGRLPIFYYKMLGNSRKFLKVLVFEKFFKYLTFYF